MDDQSVVDLLLKPGREKSLRNRHPWVFTGAIAEGEGEETAAVARLLSARGERLGEGFFSRHSQIAARVWCFDGEELTRELVSERIKAAAARRAPLAAAGHTAYRVVHAEGDDCSGLVIDRYDDLFVVEVTSMGLEQWRDTITSTLRNDLGARIVYYKNDLPSRRIEQLSLADDSAGEGEPAVVAIENTLRFAIDPRTGQKTGFFLDQRDNRALVRQLASGKDVLNLFSYTGGFGVYAAAGGARSVEEVDISAPAIEGARTNHRLNGSDARFTIADVFDYSRELAGRGGQFDLVICDPPAFAKSRGEVDRAARGYKDVNLQSLKLVRSGGHLLTFSCSGHMSLDLFQKIVYSAALHANRRASFVARLGAGTDHPVSLFCPEGEYLKGFLIRVD